MKSFEINYYLENIDKFDFIEDSDMKNRLEVFCPGKLPLDQTLELMQKGVSRIRNEALAKAFFYMNLIEGWGSGIHKINNALKASGLKEMEITGGDVFLRFTIYRNQSFIPAESGRVSDGDGHVNGDSGRVNVETGRTNDESGRVNSESGRVNDNQNGRVNSERKDCLFPKGSNLDFHDTTKFGKLEGHGGGGGRHGFCDFR